MAGEARGAGLMPVGRSSGVARATHGSTLLRKFHGQRSPAGYWKVILRLFPFFFPLEKPNKSLNSDGKNMLERHTQALRTRGTTASPQPWGRGRRAAETLLGKGLGLLGSAGQDSEGQGGVRRERGFHRVARFGEPYLLWEAGGRASLEDER